MFLVGCFWHAQGHLMEGLLKSPWASEMSLPRLGPLEFVALAAASGVPRAHGGHVLPGAGLAPGPWALFPGSQWPIEKALILSRPRGKAALNQRLGFFAAVCWADFAF